MANTHYRFSSRTSAAEKEIDKERTSALAESLRKEFLQETRTDLKSQGYKVEALENKYKQSHREKMRASMENSLGGGGVDVEQHPLMPNPEGIADNFVLPESELDSAAKASPELAHKFKNKLSYSQKQTLKEELKKKHKQRLEKRLKQKPGFNPKPSPF